MFLRNDMTTWQERFETMIARIGFDEPTTQERRERHLNFISQELTTLAKELITAIPRERCGKQRDENCICDLMPGRLDARDHLIARAKELGISVD